jgi:hypothetical protein
LGLYDEQVMGLAFRFKPQARPLSRYKSVLEPFSNFLQTTATLNERRRELNEQWNTPAASCPG